VYDCIPGESGIVDDDMDLAIASKGRGLPDQSLNVASVHDVAGHRERSVRACVIDVPRNLVGLFCTRFNPI
jgi:hypothetical protein